MPQQALLGRNPHPAQDQGSALCKWMCIKAYTGSDLGFPPRAALLMFQKSRSPGDILRPRDLYVARIAQDDPHHVAEALHEGGVVGPRDALPHGGLVGLHKQAVAEHLGSLHQPEPGAIEGGQHPPLAIYLLHGVAAGHRGNGRAVGGRSLDTAAKQRRGRQRPCAVVNENEIRVGVDLRECVTHRGLPVAASADHLLGLRPARAQAHAPRLLDILRRYDEDDLLHLGAGPRGLQRVEDKRAPSEINERLVSRETGPFAAARRCYYRADGYRLPPPRSARHPAGCRRSSSRRPSGARW